MKAISILDRNGTPMTVGAKVMVQRCVGRYGRVDHVEGTIEQFVEHHGAVLRLAQPARRQMHDHDVWVRPGEQLYVSFPGKVDGDNMVCFHRFEDFEHGHETWVQVIQ